MKKKQTKTDRGQLLATAVQASGLNKEDVADKAGYSRSAYYKHIQEPDLDYSILIKYGKAIGFDFTDQLPDMPKYLLSEPSEIYGKPKTLEEALVVLEQWRDKYLDLMEKYKVLLEERIEKS